MARALTSVECGWQILSCSLFESTTCMHSHAPNEIFGHAVVRERHCAPEIWSTARVCMCCCSSLIMPMVGSPICYLSSMSYMQEKLSFTSWRNLTFIGSYILPNLSLILLLRHRSPCRLVNLMLTSLWVAALHVRSIGLHLLHIDWRYLFWSCCPLLSK